MQGLLIMSWLKYSWVSISMLGDISFHKHKAAVQIESSQSLLHTKLTIWLLLSWLMEDQNLHCCNTFAWRFMPPRKSAYQKNVVGVEFVRVMFPLYLCTFSSPASFCHLHNPSTDAPFHEEREREK